MDPPPPLTTTQVASLLRGTAATLVAEAEALGIAALRWHPAPREWCVNEVLGHMIEAARRSYAGRILLILEQPGRKLESWFQAEIAHERRDCERDGQELLEELASTREGGLRILDDLRPKQLELSGEHPNVGTLRVVDLLHEWPHHDRAHVQQVLKNTQAYVWPHMGNAQRFSD